MSIHNLPLRPRKNPAWLRRAAHWIGDQRAMLSDYRYYRSRGFTVRAAWFNATNTPTLRKASR